MKLLTVRVVNFRCFKDSGDIPFHKLTIFVGENDSGKSSLLDALSMLFTNTMPKEDDFTDKSEEIEIIARFLPDDDDVVDEGLVVNGKVNIRLTASLGSGLTFSTERELFSDSRLNDYANLSATDLKALVLELRLTQGSNKAENTVFVKDHLTANGGAHDKTIDWLQVKYAEVKNVLPIFQRYSSNDYGNPEAAVKKTLDSVYASHFYRVEELTGETTLKPSYETLRSEISTDLNNRVNHELLEQIKPYLKGATSIEGDFDIDFSRGLNFSGLKLGLDGGTPKLLSQFGEGTRKRAFLSILEWDADVIRGLSGQKIIKAYDEPDANLHYGAQRDLYTVIEKSAKDNPNIQGILCTHSLSMIDRAPAISINRVLSSSGSSVIDYLVGTDDEDIREYLTQVSEIAGIRNSSIFYEKAFLVFEGESEEASLPLLYKAYTGRSLAEDGIVLINLQTNGQWSNALKFLNKNRANSTVMLLDADTQYPTSTCQVTSQKLQDVGYNASFLSDHCFFIGTKEFEDTYADTELAAMANIDFPRHDGALWSAAHFAAIRSADKFSGELKNLLSRHARLPVGKPAIAVGMAKRYGKPDIEGNIVLKGAFDKIQDIVRNL